MYNQQYQIYNSVANVLLLLTVLYIYMWPQYCIITGSIISICGSIIEKWLELLKYRFTYTVWILIVNTDIPLAWFWSWWALSGDLSNLTWSQNQYFGPKWEESIAGVSAISIFIYYWNFTFFRKNINRPIIPMGNISPLDFDWSCCILKFVMLNSCPLESDWSCWYLGSSPGSVYMSRVLRVAPGMPTNIDYWLLARYDQPIYIGVIWVGSCDSPNIFYHWKVTGVVAFYYTAIYLTLLLIHCL